MNESEAFWELIAGLATDLAIILLIIGWRCDIPTLMLIGGVGFFLACSPALIAAPLMWLFGLYIATLPFILLYEYCRKHDRRKHAFDNAIKNIRTKNTRYFDPF